MLPMFKAPASAAPPPWLSSLLSPPPPLPLAVVSSLIETQHLFSKTNELPWECFGVASRLLAQ